MAFLSLWLMVKILHDLKDPRLWYLRYIPHFGSCSILSISRMKSISGCVITQLHEAQTSFKGRGRAKEFCRAPKQHISKNKDRDILNNPLIMKPNKVGISRQNAYAYVLFGSLILAPSLE